MPNEMQSQPQLNRRFTLSTLRYAVLIGFGAGIGIGHRLSEDLVPWAILLRMAGGVFFYYRRDKTQSE